MSMQYASKKTKCWSKGDDHQLCVCVFVCLSWGEEGEQARMSLSCGKHSFRQAVHQSFDEDNYLNQLHT